MEELTVELITPEDLQRSREVVIDVAYKMGFSRSRVNEITCAVFEACANAMVHGRECGSDRAMLCVRVLPDQFVAIVKDNGAGFRIPNKIVMPGADSPRGRGLPLMAACMDDVRIRSNDGCEVTLVKRLIN